MIDMLLVCVGFVLLVAGLVLGRRVDSDEGAILAGWVRLCGGVVLWSCVMFACAGVGF